LKFEKFLEKRLQNSKKGTEGKNQINLDPTFMSFKKKLKDFILPTNNDISQYKKKLFN
jgi:hypothetical protein